MKEELTRIKSSNSNNILKDKLNKIGLKASDFPIIEEKVKNAINNKNNSNDNNKKDEELKADNELNREMSLNSNINSSINRRGK
jgi:hypothetical protein